MLLCRVLPDYFCPLIFLIHLLFLLPNAWFSFPPKWPTFLCWYMLSRGLLSLTGHCPSSGPYHLTGSCLCPPHTPWAGLVRADGLRSRRRVSNLRATDVATSFFVVGGCPVHCRKFSSTSGRCSPDASATPSPRCDSKAISRHHRMSPQL